MQYKNQQSNDFISAILAYDLWLYLAWQDIKIKYRCTKIGPFWITLSMAIFCITLGFVYSQLFKMKISELVPYLSIGIVVWGFISSCIGEMPNIFVDNAAYIKDMRINRIIILFRALTRNLIIFGHNLLIVLGIYLYFNEYPGWYFFLAIPGIVLVLINLAVIGVTLSILGARYRDIAQLTQSVLQVLFFITPIFWVPRLLEGNSWVVSCNPVSYFMDLVRSPLLGHAPETLSWIISILTALGGLVIAMRVYRHKNSTVPFWV